MSTSAESHTLSAKSFIVVAAIGFLLSSVGLWNTFAPVANEDIIGRWTQINGAPTDFLFKADGTFAVENLPVGVVAEGPTTSHHLLSGGGTWFILDPVGPLPLSLHFDYARTTAAGEPIRSANFGVQMDTFGWAARRTLSIQIGQLDGNNYELVLKRG